VTEPVNFGSEVKDLYGEKFFGIHIGFDFFDFEVSCWIAAARIETKLKGVNNAGYRAKWMIIKIISLRTITSAARNAKVRGLMI